MTSPSSAKAPALVWDVGTGYELFISLAVLHEPEYYGLRASWAAGIRSRIPAPERKFLEEVVPFLHFPLSWVYHLPKPKDAISVLWALRQIPPAKRAGALLDIEHWNEPEIKTIFLDMEERRAWEKSDLTALVEAMLKKGGHQLKQQVITNFLDWWVRPEELGEQLLASVQAYYQVYFAEEERRIQPVLLSALER